MAPAWATVGGRQRQGLGPALLGLRAAPADLLRRDAAREPEPDHPGRQLLPGQPPSYASASSSDSRSRAFRRIRLPIMRARGRSFDRNSMVFNGRKAGYVKDSPETKLHHAEGVSPLVISSSIRFSAAARPPSLRRSSAAATSASRSSLRMSIWQSIGCAPFPPSRRQTC